MGSLRMRLVSRMQFSVNSLYTRSRPLSIRCDVQDGTIIRELMRPGNFLSVPEHAALI